MLTLLKGELPDARLCCARNLPPNCQKIMADRVQLQQVFMNLVLNAIEAMKGSGGELTVQSQLQDGQLQFSVSDTGVGWPTEKMDQIFSAFFTAKPQGNGMGLAISRFHCGVARWPVVGDRQRWTRCNLSFQLAD